MKRYFFLNIDFGKTRTGIENASINRAKMLHDQFGVQAIFVTIRYTADLRKNFNDLKKSGLIPKTAMLLNPYEALQKTLTTTEINPFKRDYTSEKWKVRNLKNGEYCSIKEENKLIIAQTNDAEGNIQSVNHFLGSRIIIREIYDYHGYLSSVQSIDIPTGIPTFETYYTVDGQICMYKYYAIVDGKQILAKIVLIRHGVPYAQFNKEADFIQYWLTGILEENLGGQDYLLIDRNLHFFEIICNLKKRFSHIKLISCLHNVHSKGDIMKGQINFNYKAVFSNLQSIDQLVVLTQEQKKDIERRFGRNENIVVIPNNTTKKTVNLETKEPYKCICLARYAVEKQHMDLIKAFKKVVKVIPEATLELYGSGDLKQAIVEKIKELNLTNHVFVNDFTNETEEIYKSASLSLLTSSVEGFPLFVLESLSYGVPVIAYDVKYGLKALIKDHTNGYLIKKGDTDAFAKKVINSLQNQDKLRELSIHAKESSLAFTEDKIAEKWSVILDIQDAVVVE